MIRVTEVCGLKAGPEVWGATRMGEASEKYRLSVPERLLIDLLLRGQSVEQAAATLGLTPDQARETLAEAGRRSGVSGLRPLLARALIHAWLAR